MEQLDEAGCFVPNAPAVVEVRRVWLARDALEETATARDANVQIFMAGCLVEAHSKTQAPDAAEGSAVAFLRSALRGPDPDLAGPAMMMLGPVLNRDDMDVIVRLGSTNAKFAMPAVTVLGLQCTAEAKAGVAAIQAACAATEQAGEIQSLVEGNAPLCDEHGRPVEYRGQVRVKVER
jgi:hypothetical protein